jgi:hypothetical protein
MSKQVEVPEGIKRFDCDIRSMMFGAEEGHWIRVEDLPAIYKHFSDRLLSDEVVEAALWAERHWDVVAYLAHVEGGWEWISDKVAVFETAERAYREAEDRACTLRKAATLLQAASIPEETQ